MEILEMRLSINMFAKIEDVKEYITKILPKENDNYVYCTKKSSNIKNTNYKYMIFTYEDYIVGYASIDYIKNNFIENIKEKGKEFEDLYQKEGFKYLYKIKVKMPKIIPLVELEKAGCNDDILFREKGSRGVVLYLGNLKNEKILLREYKDALKEDKVYQEYITKEKKNSIIRHTNLHRYEDMHSNFLVNFIKKDNIFKPGTFLFKKFLNLIGVKYHNIIDFDVNPRCSFAKKDAKTISNVKIKNIKPDIFITYKDNDETKYILVEAKLQALESEYEIEKQKITMKQTEAYYKYFDEKYGNKVTFVFLSMYDENKCLEIKNISNYKKITFQDLIDKVYEPDLNYDNQEVLTAYLHSFHIMYHVNFYDKYFLIPNTHLLVDEVKWLKKDKTFNDLLSNILNYKVALSFETDDEVAYFKYLLHIYDNELLVKIIKLINK